MPIYRNIHLALKNKNIDFSRCWLLKFCFTEIAFAINRARREKSKFQSGYFYMYIRCMLFSLTIRDDWRTFWWIICPDWSKLINPRRAAILQNANHGTRALVVPLINKRQREYDKHKQPSKLLPVSVHDTYRSVIQPDDPDWNWNWGRIISTVHLHLLL